MNTQIYEAGFQYNAARKPENVNLPGKRRRLIEKLTDRGLRYKCETIY